MTKPTGKLKFAYQTISNMEHAIKHKDDQITFLWKLLDDISTGGDMFKPEINEYFKYVNKKCEDRSLVANSEDGQTLTINGI